MPAIALAAASGILPACGEKLVPETAGGVQVEMPAWPQSAHLDDAANGFVERRDGRGSRVRLSWDVDARATPVTEDDLPGATQTTVAGHKALLKDGVATWRCERSKRTFTLETAGPRAPDVAGLAAHVRCHAEPMLTNGDVPAAATSVLGPEWRFGSRGRGSISWMRDDAVLTFFAGQQAPGPRDVPDARKAAPAWVAAAGLTDAAVEGASDTAGPQSHPALEVSGKARLQGQPVRWAMMFWRCLQRQKSYAAIVFSRTRPDEGALLSARCHG